MLHRLYERILALGAHPYALVALFFIALLESVILPLATDIFLIPIVLARPSRAWLSAGVCVLASVLGGIISYGIGFGLFEWVGVSLLNIYGGPQTFHDFQSLYRHWGGWIVFIGALTPFPYKIVALMSGVVGMNLALFIFYSLIARALRYFLIAALLWRWGDSIRTFLERYLSWVLTGVLGLLFLGWIASGKVFSIE